MRLFEMDADRREILVLVHPGSACGSANSALGKSNAGAFRDGLAIDCDQAREILVLDGELSDELPHYGRLNTAIENAVKRAKSTGLLGERVFACDNLGTKSGREFPEEAVAVLLANGVRPETAFIEVSGAWFHPPEERTGCVNAVATALERAGFTVDVSDNAVQSPCEGCGEGWQYCRCDEDDDEDEDEGEYEDDEADQDLTNR